MAFSFRRLYPYTDQEASQAHWEIWVTKQVLEFARTLDAQTYWRFRNLLMKTADEGKIGNDQMYKHLGEGVFEFKFRTTRIYSFDDGRRIVLTHGDKRSDRAVGERKKVAIIKAEYLKQKGRRK